MTLTELLAEGNTYFEFHPNAALWSGKPENARSGALKLAMNDLAVFLDCPELDFADLALRTAVFEQALYLLFTSDAYRAVPESESIDGVGSVTYRPDGNTAQASNGLCPRAFRFADSVRKRAGLQIRRG